MDFFINYWHIIMAVAALPAVAVLFVCRCFGLPRDAQLNKVREWLLWAVTEAEKNLGGGTGIADGYAADGCGLYGAALSAGQEVKSIQGLRHSADRHCFPVRLVLRYGYYVCPLVPGKMLRSPGGVRRPLLGRHIVPVVGIQIDLIRNFRAHYFIFAAETDAAAADEIWNLIASFRLLRMNTSPYASSK